MTISITRYVDITSGIGAGTVATTRKLVGRLFTTNPLLAVDETKAFDNLAAVGAFFLTSSDEYKRAAFYFGWVNKSFNQPQQIQFARFAPDAPDSQTVTACLTNSASLSNDFGSFLFMQTLTNDEVVEAATWNQTENVQYLYTVGVLAANSATLAGLLTSIGGVALTLAPLGTQYPEQAPMMIAAATDYDQVNSVQNYMFQQFTLTPSVTTDANATIYDDLAINYYGQTQTAGTLISFYQRGLLQGSGVVTNITDMTPYVNEMWFKDAASTVLINLLVQSTQVPANAQGRGMVLSVLQGAVDAALNNGTISVNKILSNAQKSFITNIANDNNAWYQVQNSGYWMDAKISEIPAILPVQYQAEYTILYGKDDVIRKVVGRQILI